MNHINIFENHFKAVFPELFLAIAATIILVYGVIYNPSAYYKFPILALPVGWLSIQTLAITVLLIANGWNSNLYQSLGDLGFGPSIEENVFLIFNNVLIVDDFTSVIKVIILLSALSSILTSFDYIKSQKINSFEYVILIMFSTLSMLFIVSSYDLISMYLAIELQSLSFYVLAAFQRNNEFSTEAGLKYFILGALSSGLLLFGESIIYGFTGITNFEELTKFNIHSRIQVPFQEGAADNVVASAGNWASPIVPNSTDASVVSTDVVPNINTWAVGTNGNSLQEIPTSLFYSEPYVPTVVVPIGLLFMLVAFLFKISAVPFHMWTPDVYEGAPTSVTAFFAITPKIAILALMSRLLLDTFYDLIDSWGLIIAICSLLSMFVGTLGALNQNKIKRLFAYSSIAHVGYLLIGLATGTIEAVESLLIYIIIYILMIINVFGILLVMSKNNSWLGRPRHNLALNHSLTGQKIGTNHAEDSCANNKPLTSVATVYKWLPKVLIVPHAMASSIWNKPSPSGVGEVGTNKGFGTSAHNNDSSSWSDETEFKILKASHPLWNSLNEPVVNPNNSYTSFINSTVKTHLPYPEGTSSPKDSRSSGIYSDQKISSLTRIKKKDEYIKYITDLSTLSKTNPILAASAAIIFFSNAGVPPLAGFYGKLNVFLAAVEGSMYVLAIAGILCSVMGAFYSIRLVKIIYFHSMAPSKQRHWTPYRQISKENSILLAFTFFFTLLFFLYPSFLFTITHSAALSLCL